jgi:hypothetical protein
VSSDRLSFTRTWRQPSTRKARSFVWKNFSRHNDISPVLHLCRGHKTVDNEPIARSLHDDFVNLCLVSKQVRDETVKIFFGCNKWVLHVAKKMNSIDWMIKKWGEESLRRIKILRIEIESVGIGDDWFIHKGLERFVDVVREGAQLHILSIHWKHAWRHLSTACYKSYIPHASWLGPSRRARKIVGAREPWLDEGSGTDDNVRSASEEWYAGWPAKEMVLTPLQELRGLNGSVEGYVTEEWALWLEDCMRANKGKEPGEFAGKGKTNEVAQMLKRASSDKEFFDMLVEAGPDL